MFAELRVVRNDKEVIDCNDDKHKLAWIVWGCEEECAAVAGEAIEVSKVEVLGQALCEYPTGLFGAVHVSGDHADVVWILVRSVEALGLVYVECLVVSKGFMEKCRVQVPVVGVIVVGCC